MKTVVLGDPPPPLEEFLARRRALGQDGHDEVWEGEYHVAPAAHPWHGYVQNCLALALADAAECVGLLGTGEFNLGEPDNYRVPDAGYHRGVPSTLYVATAAMVVEVVSPHDETWNKFGFYAAHGVEEIVTAEPTEARLRWFVRVDAESYVETDRSPLLGVTVAEIADTIEWPS